MAKVVWTTEAERWLLRIHDYIAVDSPVNAFNVVESIYERAQILEQFPLVGHAYRSPSGRDLRILLWGHCRIVYLVRPDDEVHVVGVFQWCDAVRGVSQVGTTPQNKGMVGSGTGAVLRRR